jgi:hypothetical protein
MTDSLSNFRMKSSCVSRLLCPYKAIYFKNLNKVKDSDSDTGLNHAPAADGLTGTVHLHCSVSHSAMNSGKRFLHAGWLDRLQVIVQKWSVLGVGGFVSCFPFYYLMCLNVFI